MNKGNVSSGLKPEEHSELEKKFREKQEWLFKEPPEVTVDRNNPPILLYQMGKVGSTSIKFTLQQARLPNPIHHIHQLGYEGIDWNINKNNERLMENQKNDNLDAHTRMYTYLFIKYVLRQLEYARLLRTKIDENLDNIPWKIITLVRDPIMREVSDFFFTFHKHPQLVDKEGRLLHETSLEVLKEDLRSKFGHDQNWVLTWFDRELKNVFGVDVYEFPFNHEKGYTLIHSKNISILVIKLEELDRCFTGAIFELLNKRDFRLVNRNVAGQKFYYETYRYVLENITLDSHFCKKIYSSKYARHFYTNDELKKFMWKWSGPKHNVSEEGRLQQIFNEEEQKPNKLGEIFLRKNLCPGPFIRLNIIKNGSVYSCCKNYMKKVICVGNILEQSLDEIWNSPEIKELRKAVYNGNYQEICKPNCPQLIHLREESIGIGKYATDDTLNHVKQNRIHLDSPYLYITIASDPSCNLACIMCREKRISRPTRKDEKVNEVTFKEIHKNISKIKLLRFSGDGEIFFKKSAIKFFQMLKEQDTSHLTLHITTNGQLLDRTKWKMLRQLNLNRLEIGVSIDAATKQTYEKIRRYGKWDRLVRNMNMLGKARKKGDLHYLVIHFVVMKSNLEEMTQFVQLGKQWNCDGIDFARMFDKPFETDENFFNPPDNVYLKKLSGILHDPVLNDPTRVWINQLLPFKVMEKSP